MDGPQLRKRRKLHGIGLVTMARFLHISAPYLLDLERGHRTLRPEVAARYRTGLAKLPRRKPSVRV